MEALLDIIDLLFCRTWWTYRPLSGNLFSEIYHFGNLLEGCAWLTLAALVLARAVRHQRRTIEIWYGLAFLTFALTDFREAWSLQSWLIWLKAINLMALLWLRHRVIKTVYPAARLF